MKFCVETDEEIKQRRLKAYETIIKSNRLLKLKQRQNLKKTQKLVKIVKKNSVYNKLQSYESVIQSNRLLKARRKCVNATSEKTNENEEHFKIKKENWIQFNNIGFSNVTSSVWENSPLLKVGTMSVKCPYCAALLFEREPKGLCCGNGKVKLESFHEPPKLIRDLLKRRHLDSSHFITNIRSYNNAFSFTSFGTSV